MKKKNTQNTTIKYMNFGVQKVLRDYIILEVIQTSQSRKNELIMSTSSEHSKYKAGKVLMVSDGKGLTEKEKHDGEVVNVGDVIMFKGFAGEVIDPQNPSIILITMKDIVAVLEGLNE